MTFVSFAQQVVVFADSISTEQEARKVLRKMRWNETTSFKEASGILVVCRSSLTYPLNSRYENVQDLKRNSQMQLNISGPMMHVYVFQINDDLSVSEINHIHYPFEEY